MKQVGIHIHVAGVVWAVVVAAIAAAPLSLSYAQVQLDDELDIVAEIHDFEDSPELNRDKPTWRTLSSNVSTALEGTKVSIKTGPLYNFVDADLNEQVRWGVEWVMNPSRASTRTRMFTYKISDVEPYWSELRSELSGQPVRVAFVTPVNEKDFIAVPVKWNESFAEAIEYVLYTGEQLHPDAGEILVSVTAQDLATQSNLNDNVFDMISASPHLDETVSLIYQYEWSLKNNELSNVFENRDGTKISMIRPANEYFIAFDKKPESLTKRNVSPVQEILSDRLLNRGFVTSERPVWPTE